MFLYVSFHLNIQFLPLSQTALKVGGNGDLETQYSNIYQVGESQPMEQFSVAEAEKIKISLFLKVMGCGTLITLTLLPCPPL